MFKMPGAAPSFYKKRIWHSNIKNQVYVTFDDGPHPKITPWLLNLAKAENIRFNFFWLGKNVECFPESISLAKENDHFVANHGYDHLHYKRVPNDVYFTNFLKGKNIFPDNAFRPPYGRLSPSLAKRISPHSPIIMWSWLSYDWQKELSNEKILKKLEKTVTAGDILVFHESDKTFERIFELIPAVVSILKKKGLTLSTLDRVIKEYNKYE